MKPTAKEIAFRNFYEILKTPPMAMVGYYKNVIRAFTNLFYSRPELIHELNSRIREIELLVGVLPTETNLIAYQEYKWVASRLDAYKKDYALLEAYLPLVDDLFLSHIIEGVLEHLSHRIEDFTIRVRRKLLQVQPIMNLASIERYMENNANLKSFFKEGGVKVTQFEIEDKLNQLIDWMNEVASDEMQSIRFTTQNL